MSMWLSALFWGAVAGLGVALLVREFMPSSPKLAAAFERLGSVRHLDADRTRSRGERLGAWIESRFSLARLGRASDSDLAVTGESTHAHLARKATYAVVGFTLFFLLGLTDVISGEFASMPLLLCVPLALACWILPDARIKRLAVHARQDFSRAIGAYFEMVAMSGYGGKHPAAALANAAEVGRSWVFVRIRQELIRSRLAGEQPWDGLSHLSREIGVPELGDLADIMRLSGEKEVTIYATLRARGKALRTAQLTDEKTGANKKTVRMTLPLVAMAVSFIAILATPALIKLFSL
ncbi:TadC protein [Paenarthrobacter nicotinovorans]|uniref:TadC protein n=1 Tax=Paenarthrobacter nicotinovorans TaxID=29320 RepID=UPI00119D1014|nr:TadC protein [Paenarthrobacter nicotinovorans]